MKIFTLWSKSTCSNSGTLPYPTALKTRNRFKIGSLLVLMIFGLAMFMPSKINAQSIIVDANPADWEILHNTVPQPATYVHIQDAFGNTVDDQFTQGSKDFFKAEDLRWADGQTKAKNDIANAAAYIEGTILYFAADKTSNNGDAQIGFWFYLGNTAPRVLTTSPKRGGDFFPPHQIGDLLVLADFINGGRNPIISAYEWVGVGNGAYGNNNSLDLLTAVTFGAQNNLNDMRPVPAGWGFPTALYDFNEFFEGSIDLATVSNLTNFCFTHFLAEGRASQSITAALDDFASGAFDVQPTVSVADIVKCEGDDLGMLTAIAMGGLGTLTYEWTLPDASIVNTGTDNTLIPNQAGTYSVVVIGEGVLPNTECESDPDTALVTINPNPAPSVDDEEECAGDTAIFSTALVAGYTYQWAVSTDSGANYTDLGGETGNTLTLNNVTLGMSGNYYRVVATDGNFTTNCTGEDFGILTVRANPAPSVDDEEECAGDTAIFSTASVAGYTYQWAVSTDSGANYTDLGGETGNTLTLNNVTLGMSGNYYRVVATDGNFTTNCTGEDFGILTVRANPVPSVENQTDICAGDTAIFSTALVAGYTYQWAVSTDSGANYTDLGGETGNTLTLNNVTLGMSGNYYRVVATDGNFTTNCTGEDFGILTVITCAQEGCTLGYWKNHTDQWCDDYKTCDLYSSIFTPSSDFYSKYPNLTLLEALNLEGNTDGENLARQSVAALLNICSEDVSYPEFATISALQTYVNAAFGPGAPTVNDAGWYLDGLNQSGCPLGGTSATTEPSEECPVSLLKAAEADALNNETSMVENSFSVSPVPFRESLNVQYDFDYLSDAKIQMFDMQGRLLSTHTEANASKGKITKLSINFRTLPSQIYIIKVTTDRDVFTKKIISDK